MSTGEAVRSRAFIVLGAAFFSVLSLLRGELGFPAALSR